jgi:hypothetical protein
LCLRWVESRVARTGVRNSYVGRVLTPFLDSNGYPRVCLQVRGKQKMFFVHRLVAQAFVQRPSSRGKLVVHHKDSVPSNCSAVNLEYVTVSDNVKHAIALGLRDKAR